MFNKYHSKYSPYSLDDISDKRKENCKSAVFSRISSETEVYMKNTEERSKQIDQYEEPKTAYPAKLSPARFILPVAAAALVAAAIPFGVKFINSRNALPPIAGASAAGEYSGASAAGEFSGASAAGEISVVAYAADPLSELSKDELIEKFKYEPRSFDGIIKFNGFGYDVNEHGSVADTGEVTYDNTFKAQGLRIITDENGCVFLVKTDKNPDIYYFMIETAQTPASVGDIYTAAYTWDLDGNVRLVIGKEAENITLSENEVGTVYKADRGSSEFSAHIIENGDETESRFLLRNGGGIDINWEGTPGITIYKHWYFANDDALKKANANYNDIFQCADGSYSYLSTNDPNFLWEIQYGAFGEEPPDPAEVSVNKLIYGSKPVTTDLPEVEENKAKE